MKRIIAAIALIVSTALSIDLTFVSGPDCTGNALYGRNDLPNVSCYNMSAVSILQPAQSVNLINIAPGENVKFYSDTECQDEIYSASVDSCFNEPNGYIGSFQIQVSQQDKRSQWARTTKEVVSYGIKLSNYTGLAVADPGRVDLGFNYFYIGVSLVTLAGGLTLSGFVVGCVFVDTTNVPSLYGCIVGPIATIAAAAGSYFLVRAGQRINQGVNMALGTFNDVKKRDLINEVNFDYMSSIMKRDDIGAEHVGFQTRDMGDGIEQRSPLYEIDGADGKYHLTAFYDQRSSSFVKHIHRAEESGLEVRYDRNNKRQISYNDVRWDNGGFDFSECQYGGSTSGFSSNPSDNWQTAYDQLNCWLTDSSIAQSATGIQLDLHNTAGTIIGEVQIVGYSGSYNPPPDCNAGSAPVNEDCIVA